MGRVTLLHVPLQAAAQRGDAHADHHAGVRRRWWAGRPWASPRRSPVGFGRWGLLMRFLFAGNMRRSVTGSSCLASAPKLCDHRSEQPGHTRVWRWGVQRLTVRLWGSRRFFQTLWELSHVSIRINCYLVPPTTTFHVCRENKKTGARRNQSLFIRAVGVSGTRPTVTAGNCRNSGRISTPFPQIAGKEHPADNAAPEREVAARARAGRGGPGARLRQHDQEARVLRRAGKGSFCRRISV